MVWRSYLVFVTDPPVATDSFTATVRYDDAPTGRSITRDFKFVSGMTGADMKAAVLEYRDGLRSLDALKAQLATTVGQEIT